MGDPGGIHQKIIKQEAYCVIHSYKVQEQAKLTYYGYSVVSRDDWRLFLVPMFFSLPGNVHHCLMLMFFSFVLTSAYLHITYESFIML